MTIHETAERLYSRYTEHLLETPSLDRPIRITREPLVRESEHGSMGGDRILLRNGAAGTFLIRDGHTIIVDPSESASDAVIGRILIGRAFGYLLHQQGRLTLHASATRISDQTVLFVGHSGMGKSTTAGAFLDHGHELLACDIANIEITPGEINVYPTFPLLKLSDTASETLQMQLDPAYPSSDEGQKSYYDIQDSFVKHVTSLDNIYVLTESTGPPRVESFEAATKMMALVRHTYAKPIIQHTGTVERNLTQCATVADSVSVKKLHRPNSLDKLPEIVETIQNDLKA